MEGRIQALGARANALMKAGVITREEVLWLAKMARQEGTLIGLEWLIANLEKDSSYPVVP